MLTLTIKDGSRKKIKIGDYVERKDITTSIGQVVGFTFDERFGNFPNIKYILHDLSLSDEEHKVSPNSITRIIPEDEILKMWISKNEAIIKSTLEKIKHLHKKIKDSRKNIRNFKKQLAKTQSEKGQPTL